MLTGTRRTVLMLAGCQALSMTGGSIVGLTGAIVGNMLTPDKALSTLPIAVQQAGVMAATIPAALLMARIGRRPGFWLGTAIGGIGAVIATWAISQEFRVVLRRHFSAGSQSRRDAAIPLCRRRDCRPGISLESDLPGASRWRGLGGVRR